MKLLSSQYQKQNKIMPGTKGIKDLKDTIWHLSSSQIWMMLTGLSFFKTIIIFILSFLKPYSVYFTSANLKSV